MLAGQKAVNRNQILTAELQASMNEWEKRRLGTGGVVDGVVCAFLNLRNIFGVLILSYM